MKNRVLIFPGGMPRSLEYLQQCLRNGRDVLGASSLGYDPSQSNYPTWIRLPFVTDPEFNHALRRALEKFNIGEIYTPNIVIWNHLRQTLPTLCPGVLLANASPVEEMLGGYRTALAKAHHLVNSSFALASRFSPPPFPNEIEVAALIRYADVIPGMCDDDKLRALLEVGRHAVKGDIVEIGSWWGKSAFILSRISRWFDIGKLLCIDPWANDHLIQGEALVDSGSAQVDANEALKVFQIGMLPFNANHINYLRATSAQAVAHYKNDTLVRTDVFGCTEYSGRISILHVDGNHTYDAVKADIELWTGLVDDGGWIIIDDYVWPYGDGPRRVSDEFLLRNYARVTSAFVMGSALFVQIISPINR